MGTSSTLIFGCPVVPWVCFRYLIATTRIYVCQDYLWLAVTLLLRHSNCPKFHPLCARENSFKLFPYGSKLAIKTQVTKTTPFQSFIPQLLTALIKGSVIKQNVYVSVIFEMMFYCQASVRGIILTICNLEFISFIKN